MTSRAARRGLMSVPAGNITGGLLGVSGTSADMRALRASGSVAAEHAIDLFTHRVVRGGASSRPLGACAARIATAIIRSIATSASVSGWWCPHSTLNSDPLDSVYRVQAGTSGG